MQESRRMQCAKHMVLLTVMLIASGRAFASKEPKTYPEEGKIVGRGTKAYVSIGHPSVMLPFYTVETDTKTFELICGTRKGCGGDKKLDIGDVIHFRIDQKHGVRCAFIQAPKGGDASREEYLLIGNEELKPTGTDKAPAGPPTQDH